VARRRRTRQSVFMLARPALCVVVVVVLATACSSTSTHDASAPTSTTSLTAGLPFRVVEAGWGKGRYAALGVVDGSEQRKVTRLRDGTVGKPYTRRLAVLGGVAPFRWKTARGKPPIGVTFNVKTGRLSGVPRASGISRMFVEATDSERPPRTTPVQQIV